MRAAFARFFAEVRALRDEVEQDGASFALMVFPFRFQVAPGAPQPVAQRRDRWTSAREEGLRCLDLLPALAAARASAASWTTTT